MATIADSGFPNLLNYAKRLNPQGSVEVQMADTLTKLLPMLQDMPFKEGNLPTGDRVVAVNGLPSPTWRRMNQGLQPTKGTTLQYDETVGMLEAYAKIDVALADLNGNAAAYRMTENMLFLEGITQEFARAVLYESTLVNPEKIHGLAARYPASTGYTSSPFVLKSGTPASANCQSVWIITWDPQRVTGIFPKGSVVGLQHKDMGEQLVPDASNLQFRAYVSHYKWLPGIEVKDFRYAVRLQWDPSDAAQVDANKTLYLSLTNAIGTLWERTPNTRIYWSRTTRNKVAAQLASSNLNYLQYVSEGGELLERFLGITCRITDSLVAETAIA